MKNPGMMLIQMHDDVVSIVNNLTMFIFARKLLLTLTYNSMKKTSMILTIGFLLAAISSTNAQRCGTTEYYNLRKQTNSSLQTRHDHVEQITQAWLQRKSVKYPSIPGFTPSGNYMKDIPAYAEAKREFLKMNPGKPQSPVPTNIEKLRDEKRKNNEFVNVKGGAK